jgi:hypothetical protein
MIHELLLHNFIEYNVWEKNFTVIKFGIKQNLYYFINMYLKIRYHLVLDMLFFYFIKSNCLFKYLSR